ncbi:hypothetical protein FB192DRAFT_1395952 [Mucor lusitanicus]|uniref:Uncharacterized protein n=2 Tax=Mucor circinelloides f. lusitanicus TaxID=29924 RepID=A0A168GFF5_MUCCL|nr:hypothetical protein FB192DRAFT_1395952 [Mucor lusitanicus]OAC97637.1 hypothetical protein MUCCIDRAFT_116296 [Mucor lusitanicus CBS 277.49]
MTRGEIEALPEILFSQQTKKQFHRVVGFDLGSSELSCSYSNSIDKAPATATVFLDWEDGKIYRPFFPTCILYKNWSTTSSRGDTKVGFDGRPERNSPEEGDLYIPNIKDYVIQWIQQGAQDNQPDAILVLSHFFEAVYSHFEKAFKRFNDRLDKASKTQPTGDSKPATGDAVDAVDAAATTTATTATAAKRSSLDDCRFSFAVPDSLACKSEYTNLIRKAFVQAGFLRQGDDTNRLIFLTEAVAAGYSCIHAPQSSSGMELGTNYLVTDLGYDSTKLAIIQAQRTGATSSVLPSTHENTAAGYRSLSDNFRRYITERSDKLGLDIEQPEEVDLYVDAFEKYRRRNIDLNADTVEAEFTAIDKRIRISNKELREHVFKPYLDGIFSVIFKHCQAHQVAKIFFRGQYCEDSSFSKTCSDFVKNEKDRFRRIPILANWDEQPKHMVSNGAVSYGLRSASAQVPVFVPSKTPGVQADESEKVHEATDSNTSSEKFSYLGLPKGYFAVGIDFGTTFSGCSYADIGEMKEGDTRAIKTIDDWNLAYEYQKISTALVYNENSLSFSDLWGFDALKTEKLKHGDRQMQHFKLLLSPENVNRFYGCSNREIKDIMAGFFMVEMDTKKTTKSSKNTVKRKVKAKPLTPVDIIAEYLKKFNVEIKKHLHEKTKIPKKSLKLKYIITVPAMWTTTGRATMIEAAIKAGLIKSGESKSIQLITEPEAAALSCEDFMNKVLKTSRDVYTQESIFTVFDAGGGTVDLVTFRLTIKTTKDGKEEKKIEQIGDGTGDTCGGAYLDTIFREAINNFYTETMGRSSLGEDFYNLHMEIFKKKIKKTFMPSRRSDTVRRIDLPPLPTIPLDTEAKPWKESTDPDRPKLKCRLVNKNKVLEIPESEIKRCIFDPVVDKAVDVLRTHLKESSVNHRPSAILMVGGFSQSKYLQERIQEFCREEGIPHVSAPPNGATAISRGAVSYFLNPRLVSRKITSSSYAICVDLDSMSNYTSHLCYFIRKGASIEVEEKLYTKTVSVMYPGSAVIALFANDERVVDKADQEVEPYTTNDDNKIKKVAEYVIDLPDSPLLSPGTKVDLLVSFKASSDGVSLDIKSKNDKIKLQTSGQITKETCISFKRIEMDPLKVNLTANSLSGFNLFGIFRSK